MGKENGKENNAKQIYYQYIDVSLVKSLVLKLRFLKLKESIFLRILKALLRPAPGELTLIIPNILNLTDFKYKIIINYLPLWHYLMEVIFFMTIGLVLSVVVAILAFFGLADSFFKRVPIAPWLGFVVSLLLIVGALIPNITIGSFSMNIGGFIVPVIGSVIFRLLHGVGVTF